MLFNSFCIRRVYTLGMELTLRSVSSVWASPVQLVAPLYSRGFLNLAHLLLT